jgi:hypothetical protein
VLAYVPMYALTPRLILNIRELYARDVQGRRGEGIDTGFGLLSTRGGADGTTMVFANVEPNEGLEDDARGRCGDGIDTGAGLGLSSSGHRAVGPAIELTDVEPYEGLENIEEVPGTLG